jgi:hypothetical protein
MYDISLKVMQMLLTYVLCGTRGNKKPTQLSEKYWFPFQIYDCGRSISAAVWVKCLKWAKSAEQCLLCTASPEIPDLLWNPNIHQSAPTNLFLDPVLRERWVQFTVSYHIYQKFILLGKIKSYRFEVRIYLKIFIKSCLPSTHTFVVYYPVFYTTGFDLSWSSSGVLHISHYCCIMRYSLFLVPGCH